MKKHYVAVIISIISLISCGTAFAVDWSAEPYALSQTEISMEVAAEPNAAEYRFVFVSSPTAGLGGTSSEWQSSQVYIDDGLSVNHQYGYQVEARDSNGVSLGTSATVNKYTLTSDPVGVRFGTISTVYIYAAYGAENGYLDGLLNRGNSGYIVYCKELGTNSTWRTYNTTTRFDGLLGGRQYTFTSKLRNGDGIETAESEEYYAYTKAYNPGVQPFSDIKDYSITANWSANNNGDGTEYFCENITNGANSGWTTDTSWICEVLLFETEYGFRVKARNAAAVETSYVNLGSATTPLDWGKALNPDPSVGEVLVWQDGVTLGWTVGNGIENQRIYFGTDSYKIADCGPNSSLYQGDFATNSFGPIALEDNTCYYWRVDGVDTNGNVHRGDVWSFTTVQEGPVGWWKFDEGTGNVFYDSSGNGNHGTVLVNQGAKNDANYVKIDNFVPGASGFALQLDGTWHTAYIPHDDVLKPHQQLTISMWLRADELVKDGNIFDKSDGGGYGASANVISIATTKLNFRLFVDAHRLDAVAPLTPATFADGQWHLYTCTYDGTAMRIYIDGEVAGERPCSGELGVCGSKNIFLGSLGNYCATADPGVVHYDGEIDDLRVYARALSQKEIQDMVGSNAGATDPAPGNGAKSVDAASQLSWTGSSAAESFDVYLGTDSQAVEDADTASGEFILNQTADVNSYDPAGLAAGTVYYWRVDEVNGVDVTEGQIWNFETLGDVDPNLIGWWTFDEASDNIAYDSSGNDNTGTIAGNPIREGGVFGNAVVFFGTNEYMSTPDESAFDISENVTLAAWVKVSEFDDSAMYIISKSESYYIYKDLDLDVITFLCEGTGRPTVGTVSIVDGKWHHIVGVYDGVTKSIYVDGQLDVSKGSSGPITTNDNPLYIGNDFIWSNQYSGSIDDARVYNRALSAAEVTEMSDVIFSVAHFPVPADQGMYVQLDSELSFAPGSYATSHDIYFGTDYDEVAGANTLSDTFQGNQTGLTFDPGALEVETTYYWRVDELEGTEVVAGNTWSFTTTDIEPNPNLVGRWSFDEGIDYIAYDSSGNGHDGELIGDPYWNVVERMGMNLYIGYNDNRVEISDESAFDITDEITITTWIKNNGFKYWGDNDAIVHKGTDAWLLRRSGGWGAADSLLFDLEDVGTITTAAPVTIANDEWHHIAATYNGSEMCFYIDGQLNNSVSASGQIATNSTPVWIGNSEQSEAGDVLEGGRLKDVRIYNKGLSASEIAEIATPPYTSNPSPAHKAIVESENIQLTWKAGKGADSHNVYLGDSYLAVIKATEASDVFQGNVAGNTLSLPTLEVRKSYYWRVDAVKGSNVKNGNLWRFYVPCKGGDLEGDANGDGVVNMEDYALVTKNWAAGESSVATASLSCSTLGDSDGIKMSLDSIMVDLSTDADGYAKFYSYDAQSVSAPGEPELPWKVVMALLPPEADLSTVTARFDEVVYKTAAGSWNVRPTGPPALWDPNEMKDILFWPEGKNIVDGLDVDVYENNALWPAEEVKVIGTGKLRKWKMVQIAVPLVRYNPVSGELVRLAMADISIDFNKVSVQSLNANVYSKADVTGYDRASKMTVNFDQFADNYDVVAMNTASANSGDAEGLAYLIFTTDKIINSSTKMAEFVAHKQALGYDVSLITKDDFDDGDSETKTTLDIRNWLINYQDTNPNVLEYVLFVGNSYPDGSEIPMYNNSNPTDLYFAELDTYSLPFIADVLVGRIPYYGAMADLDQILAKTIDYENQFSNTLGWRKNSLLMMKSLNEYANPSNGTIGGTSWWLGEQVKDEILVPNGRNYHRIYDVNLSTDYSNIMPIPETWPLNDYTVVDTWGEGKFGLAMFTTHGGPTSASGVINLDVMGGYHDAYPSFLVQCSCSTADPKNRRNLSYEFLKNQSVTVVGSTTPSYYTPSRNDFDQNDGYCLAQNYQYVKRVVTEGMTAGEGLYSVKAAQTRTTNMYKLNLYGDPSLKLLAPDASDFDGNGVFDFEDLKLLSDDWLEDRN